MSQLDRLEQEQAVLAAATEDILAYVNQIADADSFVQINAFSKGRSRLNGAPIAGEGVLCGTATVGGRPVVVVAQNAAAMFGSFGAATADKICRALSFAARNGLPVISVLDSEGARVGEGVVVLEGYGRVLHAVADYDADFDGMHIAVVKGPAVGMMAVYARSADICIACEGGTLSVVAPAVLRAKWTDAADTVTAEGVAREGGADFLAADVTEVASLIEGILCWRYNLLDTEDDPNREAPALQESVTADALLAALCDEGTYIEYGAAQKGAIRCVLTYVNGSPIGVTLGDAAVSRLSGQADTDKLARFVRFVRRAGAPLVNLIDSDGFADKAQTALAESLSALAAYLVDVDLKIAVIVGHAVGSAYTMLASKGMGYDYTLAFADAVISPVAPDAAVHLLYTEELRLAGNTPEVQTRLAEAYRAEHSDAFAAAADGQVDEVIHPATLRPYVANALYMLRAE